MKFRFHFFGLMILAAGLAACQLGEPGAVARGKAYFHAYKCNKCHQVGHEAESGVLGPDLTFVGFRKSADFLDRWLINPQAWKPHVSMPNFYLQPNVRKDLVAFLASLKGDEYLREGRPWDAKEFKKDKIKRGREIYNRAGCVTCHNKDGVGGYPNNNVVGGLIPAVNGVADTFSRDELIQKIAKGVRHPVKADPSGPEPLLYMPRWEARLTRDEIEAIADYLISLKGRLRRGGVVSDIYSWTLPVKASTFAAEIDRGIWIIHAAMALIFVLWAIFITYLLIKYRARDGHKAERVHIDHNKALMPDIAVLTFEILLVVFYAIPSWSRIKMNFPKPENSTQVEILAEQFNWSMRYPGPDGKFGKTSNEFVDFTNPFGIDPKDATGHDDVVTVNEMRLPVNKPVLARLTSKDVIHSFFIPAFRIKQDATPGLNVPVWFEPTRIGDYEITCAQLCGVGHAIMRADVKVTSQEEFDAWIVKASAERQKLWFGAANESEEW